MAFRFQPGEAVPEGVRRVATEELVAALDHLGGGAGPMDEAVHESRKSLKRLRALLRLVRDGLGPSAYRGENACFRDCGRLLAGPRDAAVLAATLDDLAPELDLGVTTFARLRGALTPGTVTWRDPPVVRVRTTLVLALARIGSWPLDGAATAVGPGLERVYGRGRRAMAAARDAPTPARLHEWRKRVKYHWHHVQLVSRVGPGWLAGREEEVHDLSDLLGDDHDLHVLAETVSADPARYGPAAELAGLLRAIGHRRAGLLTQALAKGRTLYADPPRRLVSALDGRLPGGGKSAAPASRLSPGRGLESVPTTGVGG
ncbi:MAG: CHAD domain-containing protein [Acidimicrobiales bacterium]